MLSGLFLNQAEAMQVLQDGEYRGGNWFAQCVAKTSFFFRLLQGKLEAVLASTVSWSLERGRFGRRLFVLTIPVSLLIASIFLLPPADYLPEGNRNLLLWLAEPLPGTSIPEKLRLSEAPRNFLREQSDIQDVLAFQDGQFRAIMATLKPDFATSSGL